MSRTLNQVSLIGNVGADPETRSTAAGRSVSNFSLATSQEWKGADGATQSRTSWHNIVVWGAASEAIVARFVRKGTRVFVSGTLEYRSYEDREGVRKYVTEINAREIILLDAADRRSEPSARDVPPPSDEDAPPALRQPEQLEERALAS